MLSRLAKYQSVREESVMLGSKEILHDRHSAYGSAAGTNFSWKNALHGAMLVASLLFVTALVFGAI